MTGSHSIDEVCWVNALANLSNQWFLGRLSSMVFGVFPLPRGATAELPDFSSWTVTAGFAWAHEFDSSGGTWHVVVCRVHSAHLIPHRLDASACVMEGAIVGP